MFGLEDIPVSFPDNMKPAFINDTFSPENTSLLTFYIEMSLYSVSPDKLWVIYLLYYLFIYFWYMNVDYFHCLFSAYQQAENQIHFENYFKRINKKIIIEELRFNKNVFFAGTFFI